jgi:quinol-cytochrome oxidoreductase complex cytochrome b subunit
MHNSGFKTLFSNIKKSWQNIFTTFSVSRLVKTSDLERSRAVSKNFFLHIHSAKVHLYTLRPYFTLGLGIITFSLFLILIITGILLMFYYIPSVERAYQSVQDITFVVMGGGFIRNMHRWSAHGMVFVVMVHMARVFYTSAYTGSRRINWIVGLLLLLITMLFSFSGYLLPWDQLAYWAVTIAANIAASVNEFTDLIGFTAYYNLGDLIKLILFGDIVIGQPALTRFFLLHVVFLPISAIILIGFHFWRIRKSDGLNIPPDADNIIASELGMDLQENTKNKRYAIWSWTTLLWIELFIFVACLTLILISAYIVDAPLRSIANPSIPENPAKSPWYFLGIQELVSYSAFSGGIVIPILVFVVLFALPFLDRENIQPGHWFSGKEGRLVTGFSSLFAIIITILIMLALGFSGISKSWPFILKMLVNPGTVLAILYAVWSFLILIKTHSTRMAALALFTCGVWGYIIITVVGIWLRGPNWEIVL